MSAGEWTPEATAAIDLCHAWAMDVTKAIGCDVFLFGSAIYDGGDQFDPQSSDLDLVIVLHGSPDATTRAERLARLRQFKAYLELQMVPTLRRTNCGDPGTSVVPISQLELQANIHKSGARRFFDKNIFLNLATMKESVALPGAGTYTVGEDVRQALEYAQKLRNEYLGISANGTGGIPDFDEADPIPKAIARMAAQLIPDAEEGAWYDTRFGLEHIFSELMRRRTESDALKGLYRKISVRRGGRGHKCPLNDFDQLLLAELLYDLSATAPLEPVATWDIRFEVAVPSKSEQERLLSELRRLVPDAQIIGVFDGSIIVRLRSSKRSYLTISRLYDLDVLATFFGVESVKVSEFDVRSKRPGFGRAGAVELIANQIAKWRPRLDESGSMIEASLATFLTKWLHGDGELSGAIITREALVGEGPQGIRADILIQFREGEQDRTLAIEVTRFHNRSRFFQQLERILRLSLPTILVVIGKAGQLESLQGDFDKLAEVEGLIRIVPILVGE